MEDPAKRWEIQEYSPEENCCRVSWILNKGLQLGKKMAVTGLVISSAPLIIPSVVAISAVGFVCSVPCGFFLVSYTCTEKLMSKLLPRPAPGPLLLEYGETLYDEEEVDRHEIQEGEATLSYVITSEQKGEEVHREYMTEESGMGIDLIGKGSKGLGEGDISEDFLWHEGSRRDIKQVMEDVYAIEEENRNEDDIGVCLEDEEKPSADIEEKIERMAEGIKLEQMKKETGGEQPRVNDCQTDTSENREGEDFDLIKHDDMEEELMEEETGEFAESIFRAGDIRNDDRETVEAVDVNAKEDEDEDEDDGGQFFYDAKEPLEEADVKFKLSAAWKGKEPVIEGRSWEEPIMNEVSTDVILTEDDEKSSHNIYEDAPVEGNNLTLQACPSIDVEEEKDLVKETRGLLERIRDEGKFDHAEGNQRLGGVQLVEDRDIKKIAGNLENRGPQFQNYLFGDVDMMSEQKIANNNDVQTLETITEVQEKESVESMDLVPKKVKLKDLISNSKEEDFNSLLKSADLFKGVREPISDCRDAKSGQEPQMDSDIATQAPEDYNSRNAEPALQLNTVEGITIASYEETRETTYEGGHEYWEHENEICQSNSYINNGTYDGSQKSSSCLGSHGGSAELHVAEELGHSQVSLNDDLGTLFSKAFYKEEKMWEQVNAIRRIVGFKGSPEETCIQEIKALYLFTGVEPPISLNEHSDLVEVNNVLHFLMSILGVK